MNNAIKNSFDYVAKIDNVYVNSLNGARRVNRIYLARKCGSICRCYRDSSRECSTCCSLFIVRSCDIVVNKCNITLGCSNLGQSFSVEIIADDSEKAPV